MYSFYIYLNSHGHSISLLLASYHILEPIVAYESKTLPFSVLN